MMALWRRELPPGADEPEPLDPMDDARDFHLTDRQRHLRRIADNRRAMEKVWLQILANLAEYRSHMKWVNDRRP